MGFWDPGTTKRLDTLQHTVDLLQTDVSLLARRGNTQLTAITGIIVLFGRLDQKLDRCLAALKQVQQSEAVEMVKLENITAGVEEVEDVQKSVVTLIQNLHNELVNAGTDQAKLDELANRLKSSADAMAAAVVANTDAEPPAGGGAGGGGASGSA